jgi:hypothetical protein
MLVQFVEDLVDSRSVVQEVRFGVYEDVIHVDRQPVLSEFLSEQCVYHCLEGGWGVGHPEEHYLWLEEAMVRDECRLPLVSVAYPYVVVSPADVELGEQAGSSDSCNEFRDEWEWCGVSTGPFVEFSVVLYWSELSVFLFDEEEWGCKLAFGLGDVSLLEVFLEEGCGCFLLRLG